MRNYVWEYLCVIIVFMEFRESIDLFRVYVIDIWKLVDVALGLEFRFVVGLVYVFYYWSIFLVIDI